jgi:Tfp pilus assembly protein PilN
MSTATAIRTADFPRVNLLPGEIAEEQRFRSLRAMLALAVVGAVAGVGALWYLADQQVSSAQDGLAVAQTTNTALKAEAAKYQDVPAVYGAVEAAEANLKLAMGQEIRYSFVLNDLSLTIPSDVWLKTITVTQNVDGATPITTQLGSTAVASVTVTGVGRKQNNTAAWLSSLTKSDYYVDPYFSSSAVGEPINDKNVIEFSSTVGITDEAYSNRYSKSGG